MTVPPGPGGASGMEEGTADLWLDLFRKEEGLLLRLVDILQSDQRAVSGAHTEVLEENIRRKEALLAEMQVLEETRKRMTEVSGVSAGSGPVGAADILSRMPASRRSRAEASLERLRSLRGALAELNEATGQLMAHGLMLVRSALGLIYGQSGSTAYDGAGGIRAPSSTGRIVRRNA
ncbi:MAG: hypothetical protein Kow00128_00320 [Deltaproteobacteria bacterium]